MTTLAVVVTVDPEGQVPDQLLGAVQDLGIVIEAQFVFEGGEEALHHGVVPAAALGGHAADDLLLPEQIAVVGGPVLAALVGVQQQRLRRHLAVTEGPVEGLDHQSGIHPAVERPANDTAAEQIDPHRQIPPACRGADVGDVTRPAAVRSRGLEVLLQQVLRHPSGSLAGPGAGPEGLAGPGPQFSPLHEPGDSVATDPQAGSAQLLVDPGRAVEAPVLAEHRLDLSGEPGVLGRPLSRRLLPLPPGVVATAGHPQLPAQPGHGVLSGELIDQAKPLGGSCSLAKCAAASLKKSFSLLSSRFSLRSRASSALSSLVSCP